MTDAVIPDVRITALDFDLGDEYALVRQRAPEAGAIATFCGCVRDLAADHGVQVDALELEHYPGVTEASVVGVAREALKRWPLTALTVIHRIGRLDPGAQIVLVITASAHRNAAFDANRFVMDYLKTRAVFWKKELGPDGDRWISSRADDFAAAEAWTATAAGPAR